jgi:peroxiredoxin
MNKLKSIFISGYLTYAAVIATLNIITFSDTSDITWLVSSLIHLLPLGFIGKLFLTHTPRTDRHLHVVTIGMIGVLITATMVMQQLPEEYPMLFVYALITFSGWLIYLKWYSQLPMRNEDILKAGNILPELVFEDSEKSSVSMSNFSGSKILYMFYRGNWCPLCTAQIKEISQQYRELDELGVKTVLISPQPHKYSANIAKKFDVPFLFLTDPEGKAAQSIGIFHKNGTPLGMEVLGYSSDTVLPTVIITDEKGEIIYVDQTDNYRVRPEPETFLKVLKSL